LTRGKTVQFCRATEIRNLPNLPELLTPSGQRRFEYPAEHQNSAQKQALTAKTQN